LQTRQPDDTHNPIKNEGVTKMTSPTAIHCQSVQPKKSTKTQPHANPFQLAGRLLAQFEQDLKNGDNQRAHLVNKAILEVQELVTSQQAKMINRQIEQSWRRAVGFSF
jgi:hypothetical protein